MKRYFDAIEELPNEIKLPLIRVLELFREEIAETVKRSDFEELKSVVKELAEAQKRTEQRVEKLEDVVKELVEAQKKTEQRVEELAEAQKKTEQRVEELAEAQKKTEQRVEELAEAQRKTEEELRSLVKSHKDLKEQVGGLSHTVGYRLEDDSYKALPALLKHDFGVDIKGRLKRDYIDIGDERYIEVNILGRAGYNGKEYIVVGEAKSQLKKKDIDEFIKKAENLKRYIPEEQIRLIVTYMASPAIQRYAKEKGVKIYFSYEF